MEAQQDVAPARADAETRVQEAEATTLQQVNALLAALIVTTLNFLRKNNTHSFQHTTASASPCIGRNTWYFETLNPAHDSNEL
jgi:hypothetical protein